MLHIHILATLQAVSVSSKDTSTRRNRYNKLNLFYKEGEKKVLQVSVPGCAWSSSSLASCNYCVERARPPSVSTGLMDDCGSGVWKMCSDCCDENIL